MDCNFSGDMQRTKTTLKIEAQEIQQRDSFLYIGFIISKGGEMERLRKMSNIGYKVRDLLLEFCD